MANKYQAQWNPPKGVPTFPIGGSTVFGPETGDGSQEAGNSFSLPQTPGYANPLKPYSVPIAGGKYEAQAPLVPSLTEMWANFLKDQVGKGAESYTGPLSAGVNPMLTDLSQFVQDQLYDPSKRLQPTGGQTLEDLLKAGGADTMIGGATLEEMIKSGMPVDQTPAWTAITKAMDRTYRQGAGDIRAQMGNLGLIAGTPHAGAQTDYALQAAREKSGLLATMQTGALEAARGRQIQGLDLARMINTDATKAKLDALGVSKDFYALNLQNQQFMIQQAQSLGELFQGLDQAAIDRTFAEFLRTRPEYSPLLNFLHALSVTFPPALATQTGLGSVGAAIGNVGTIAGAAKDIIDIVRPVEPKEEPKKS